MAQSWVGIEDLDKRLMIFGVFVALPALLAVGWLVGVGSENGNTRSVSRKPTSDSADWREQLVRRGTEELRRDERGWTRQFVFMRSKTEVMPEKIRHAIAVAVGGTSPLGLRFDRAQLVPASTSIKVWVTEGDGVTCMSVAEDGSTSCDTSLHAWRQGLPLEVFKSGTSPGDQPTDFLALGVVPNWAGAVRMRTGSQIRLVQAPYGAYALRADGPIKLVSIVR